MASSQNAHLRRVHDSINNNHNKKTISEIYFWPKIIHKYPIQYAYYLCVWYDVRVEKCCAQIFLNFRMAQVPRANPDIHIG